ncbi:MAG TPA: serine--tRNA ligase [Solirubrobacteraceae bacterium]|jgi:seryl-tRNA synthetase|nr:serine--tRNA ligase [Solirubrobacteraceae bacterium]
MLDLKRIREDPDGVRAALARRGPALVEVVDQVLEKDLQWRAATTSAENLRAMQKTRSEEFAAAKAQGDDAPELRAAMQEMSAQVKEFTEQANRAKQDLDALLAPLPNLPDPSAAPGPEDALVREVGAVRKLYFPPRDHLELAGEMIDMDRGARLSGARFAYLKGDLVMLELALVRWVLEKLRGAGFEPVVPPVLVRERALYGTGFLPDTEQQIYSLPEDELFLLGTSEVALASLHDSEILERERLPLRYAGFSPCFRREAGAAGKDTRGIFRVHQFDKVEMFSFVAPEESAQEHERILAMEEQILDELGLPYRVLNIAVSDLGNSAAKKYDCEVWIPSQGRYRELTSCSNTTDYQARRLNIRVRGDARTRVLHTLNGTAVAVGRTIVALLENGQRADGSVELPQVLLAYGAPASLPPAP